MKHILETTQSEIKYSQKTSVYLQQISAFSLFRNSTFSLYKNYMKQKQKLLLYYSSVLSDISQDIKDKKINPHELLNIQRSMRYIHGGITDCFYSLEKFSKKVKKKGIEVDSVLEHEKKFLQTILSQFSLDTKKWFSHHYSEIEDEIKKISSLQQKELFFGGKEVLELQKQRLQLLKNPSSTA